MPTASTTARTPPPAITPVPGEAGRNKTRPPPNSPIVSCGIVFSCSDIFSIDCGVTLDGFVGDTATTVPVGKVSDEILALIRVTEECLDLAIEQCRPRRHLGDIGAAVQQHAEGRGYSVV